jgi:hypothetical protein
MMLKNLMNLFFVEEELATEEAGAEVQDEEVPEEKLTIAQIIERLSAQLDQNPEANPYELKQPLYQALLGSSLLVPIFSQALGDHQIRMNMDDGMAHVAAYTDRNAVVFDRFEQGRDVKLEPMSFQEICKQAVDQNADSMIINPDGPIEMPFNLDELKMLSIGKLPSPSLKTD